MFVTSPSGPARAILSAMWAVTREGAGGPASEKDHAAISAAARVVFRPPLEFDATDATPMPPEQIAGAVPVELHRDAARLIGTAVLVDPDIDSDRLRLAVRYAHALDCEEGWVHELLEVARGHFAWARADMLRRNTESFDRVKAEGGADHADAWTSDRDVQAGAVDTAETDNFFFPYSGESDADKELSARYHALGDLDPDRFGRAFHDHYARHNFRFPGERHALAESFAVPHDSAHVLAEYDTSMQGELLVATFTGGMMGGDLLATQLYPSIFNDHLDQDMHFTFATGYDTLDPHKFWVAWDRGEATTRSVFDGDWDFWGATTQALEDLRHQYGIPALDPADAAEGPDVFEHYAGDSATQRRSSP